MVLHNRVLHTVWQRKGHSTGQTLNLQSTPHVSPSQVSAIRYLLWALWKKMKVLKGDWSTQCSQHTIWKWSPIPCVICWQIMCWSLWIFMLLFYHYILANIHQVIFCGYCIFLCRSLTCSRWVRHWWNKMFTLELIGGRLRYLICLNWYLLLLSLNLVQIFISVLVDIDIVIDLC